MRSFTELWPTLKRLLAYGSPWRKPLMIAVAIMWVAAVAEVMQAACHHFLAKFPSQDKLCVKIHRQHLVPGVIIVFCQRLSHDGACIVYKYIYIFIFISLNLCL